MSGFAKFRDGVGGRLAARFTGLDLAAMESWDAFGQAARAARGAHDRAPVFPGVWQEGLRERWRLASSGERCVYLAILHAVDFTDVSDRIASEGGTTFLRLMEATTGEHLEAALACLASRG